MNDNVIEKLTKKAFINHRVTKLYGDRLYIGWRCQKPKTGIHSFNVYVSPNTTTIIGDIVLLNLSQNIKMCVNCDLYYLSTKVNKNIRTKEWSHELATNWAKKEYPEDYVLDEYAGNCTLFHQRLLEEHSFDVSSLPDCTDYTPNFLWCYYALQWFLATNKWRPYIT